MQPRVLVFSLFAISVTLSSSAEATTTTSSTGPLRVAISPYPPMVYPGTPPGGYSIDLWDAIAAELGRTTQFVPLAGASEKLDALRQGAVDVAIGGITMTPDRERKVDFTHPSMTVGLGILMKGNAGRPSIWSTIWTALRSTTTGVGIAFLILIVVAGHLVWFAERGRDMFNDRYVPGVFEGVYWAVVTASTVGYGDKAPVKWAGRVLAMFLIIISLPMFALFTAELTSAFTVDRIEGAINGPDDLRGRTVGVVAGTTSEEFTRRQAHIYRAYPSFKEATAALQEGHIEAVVYDLPALQHYVRTLTGGRTAHIAGTEFNPQNLAIAVQQGSSLREDIDRALLELQSNGARTKIEGKWFGEGRP